MRLHVVPVLYYDGVVIVLFHIGDQLLVVIHVVLALYYDGEVIVLFHIGDQKI